MPLRQWVLTLPFPLRARLAFDGRLLGAVCRLFVDSVLGWYRRRMQREGVAAGQAAAVTVIQRCSSDLKLNPHVHTVFLDGVFTVEPDGTPRFHPLLRLSDPDVADALAAISARVLQFLVRRGVIEVDDQDLTVVGEAGAERDPTLMTRTPLCMTYAPLAFGGLAGAIVTVAGARLLGSWLFGVQPLDGRSPWPRRPRPGSPSWRSSSARAAPPPFHR